MEDAIYDEFVARSVERARKRNVGNPFDLNVEQGPQVDEDQFKKILALIDTGKREGAKLLTGGQRYGDRGYFIQPTVFADVKDEMTIAREEVKRLKMKCWFCFSTCLIIVLLFSLDFWTSATNIKVQFDGRDCRTRQQDHLRPGCCRFHQGFGQSHVSLSRTSRRNSLVFFKYLNLLFLWYVKFFPFFFLSFAD